MDNYNPKDLELKWQKHWEKSGVFKAKDFSDQPKFYGLIEFPYPSGAGLHVGHPRPFTAMDVICRKKRMEGMNVLFPIGFDAFGLPTENYAIKTGRPPAEVTAENIATFTRQLKMLGFSFDWSRVVDTTDPEYYHWTQWIFLQLFKKGLAYKKAMPINWCVSCKIGLANEEVVDGKCERCGGTVEKREKEQWMLAITKYADQLLAGLDTVDYIPQAKIQQTNWIGRSEGVNFKHKVKDLDLEFQVYDSIPQTFMAQTFVIIAPEHPFVYEMVKGTDQETAVMEFVDRIKKKKMGGRFDINEDMEGIFTGRYVDNYLGTGRDLPIWVASFALVDYGTGIVGCSAHDERDWTFAKKYNLPLKPVLFPVDKNLAQKVRNLEVFYREPDGILEEPKEFSGQRWDEVREPIISFIEKNDLGQRAVNYKLRDWVFSRQRYWGEPIPLVWCDNCGGWEPLSEKELPLKLPVVKKYEPTDTGESPLAAMEDWVNTKCPRCGGPARRETDTMPNWAGSSWYFLRYCDPRNKKKLADERLLKYWLPVDWYNGGMEHTVLHLLYSRFWHHFLYDLGVVPCPEPYKKRTSHGMILAKGGEKMSKSRGNVVNPDEMVEKYGADALRTYIMFMGPFDQAVEWDTNGLVGVRRFLEKVWNLQTRVGKKENEEVEAVLHQTIKRVSEDIEKMHFNTAVARLMELTNELTKQNTFGRSQYRILLQLLSPFAPHLAEELWAAQGEKKSISQSTWPQYSPEKIIANTMTVVVQINGKVRANVDLSATAGEEEVKAAALADPAIEKWLTDKEIKKIVYIKGRLINIVI
ncbi:MAG TPA: leucine--tRNA ligase [Patescibacteria group bacterium]|nr:leucine--tRNA ligase [Patescibacteria group bacterium]